MRETTPRKQDSEWGVAGLERGIHANQRERPSPEAELQLAEGTKHKNQELQPSLHFIC